MTDFNDLLVDDLELSVRTGNVLRKAGIINMGAFMALTKDEVMGWSTAGRKTWNEIWEIQDMYSRPPLPDISLEDAVRIINRYVDHDIEDMLLLHIGHRGALSAYRRLV